MFLPLIITAIVLFVSWAKWRSTYWQRRNIKSYPTKLFFGNVENPLRLTKTIPEHIEIMYNQAKKDGLDYFGMYSLFQAPVFMPLKLDTIKLIMTKEFQHFTDRGFYVNEKDDPLSAHLFAIGGQKWRNLRVKMTPTFTAGKMRQMFQIVADCGGLLEKILEEKVKVNNEVDIKEVLGCYATDIICSCAFGLNVHSSTDPNSEFRHYGKKVFEASPLRRLKTQISVNIPRLAKILRLTVVPKDLTEFFMKVVNDTIEYRRKNNYSRHDFLQLMMEMQDKDESITLEVIAAQCFVFFAAGFETSSTTMTFALYELARKQELQDRVRAEINEVLGKYNGEINYDSMTDLKYMSQVIDETLRIWPPVPFVTRSCVKEFQIPDSDVVIEEGTKIFIPIAPIQHDEEYFPNPRVFDPERFSPENRKNIPDYAHMPFGEGPRICIGMRFGIMQSKVGLTNVLKNYRVTLSSKTQTPIKLDKYSFIPAVKGEIWLKLEKL